MLKDQAGCLGSDLKGCWKSSIEQTGLLLGCTFGSLFLLQCSWLLLHGEVALALDRDLFLGQHFHLRQDSQLQIAGVTDAGFCLYQQQPTLLGVPAGLRQHRTCN